MHPPVNSSGWQGRSSGKSQRLERSPVGSTEPWPSPLGAASQRQGYKREASQAYTPPQHFVGELTGSSLTAPTFMTPAHRHCWYTLNSILINRQFTKTKNGSSETAADLSGSLTKKPAKRMIVELQSPLPKLVLGIFTIPTDRSLSLVVYHQHRGFSDSNK